MPKPKKPGLRTPSGYLSRRGALDRGTPELQARRRAAALALFGVDVVSGRVAPPPDLTPGALQQLELLRSEMQNGDEPKPAAAYDPPSEGSRK